jgi:hypothetical protein
MKFQWQMFAVTNTILGHIVFTLLCSTHIYITDFEEHFKITILLSSHPVNLKKTSAFILE